MSLTVNTWTLDASTRLESIDCYKCGVIFAMPQSMMIKRREDGETFWCPNGHGQIFGESEADRQRKRAEQLARSLEAQRSATTSWRDQAEASERSLRATKGHLTRARNRARSGVCPVDGCTRHFADLARHIKSKHPDLVDAE